MSLKSDSRYFFGNIFFEWAPRTEGTVPSCLFLLLLLICGKTVLEPVVLGTIKHWPSKLHALRGQNKTAGETFPGSREAPLKQQELVWQALIEADEQSQLLAWLLMALVPGKCSVCVECCIYKVTTEAAGALCRHCGSPTGSTFQGVM